MELIYITNNKELARYAQSVGVERIMVDLEILGKEQRQGHLDTLISKHSLSDVSNLNEVINTSKLQVRVNPLNKGSRAEIEAAIENGADIVMLPMFKKVKEVEEFVSIVNGRAEVCLLLETPEALTRADDIISINGIDEVFVGLNDLHLAMGLDFMFELLSGGIVEYLTNKIKGKGLRYGFGGIATLGSGAIDASLVLSEHVRLDSTVTILSRSFHNGANSLKELLDFIDFELEVKNVKRLEQKLLSLGEKDLMRNKLCLSKAINNYLKK